MESLVRMAAVSALGGFAEPESLKRLQFSWGSDVTLTIEDLRLRADRLEEMTGLKFLAGSVKKLNVKLTGGIFGVLKSKPVCVEIDGLFILLGAFPDAKKDEAARKEAAAAFVRELRQRLELNSFLFRQKLSSILMENLGLSEDGGGGKEGGLFNVERIINGVVTSGLVEIKRVHIRYEDTQLGKNPFCVGVTLGAFETKGGTGGAVSGSPAPPDAPPQLPFVEGLTYRTGRLQGLAVYWDPLLAPTHLQPLIPPPGSPQESWRAWEAGMNAGIGGPGHCYILAPISPSASLAINLAKIKDKPQLQVALKAELLFSLSPRQLAAGKALGAFMGRREGTLALLKRFPPPSWSLEAALAQLSQNTSSLHPRAPSQFVAQVARHLAALGSRVKGSNAPPPPRGCGWGWPERGGSFPPETKEGGWRGGKVS